MRRTYLTTAKFTLIITIFLACISVVVSTAYAAINKQINYQGRLVTASNVAVVNGNYSLRFKLYTTASGGSPLWTEAWCFSPDGGTTCTGSGTDNRVAITDGLFSVLLGSTTALTGVDFNQTLYLGVEVGSTTASSTWDGEMTPRKKIGSVPTAIYSEDAGTVGGVASSSFFRSDTTNSTTTSTTFMSIIQSGSGKIAEFLSGTASAILSILSDGSVGVGTSTPGSTFAIQGTSSAPTRVLFSVASSSNAQFLTVLPNGNVGIGSSTPTTKLSVAGNALIDGIVTASNFVATSTTASSFVNASSTNFTVATNLYNTALSNGCLQVTSGLFSSTGSSCGGSGNSAFTIGNGFIYNATTTDTVAIGSTTAIATLNVRGNGSNNPFIVASSTGTQLLTLLHNGNFGIGSSTPTTKLSVAGNALIDGIVTASNFVATSTTASSFTNASTTNLTVAGKLFDSTSAPGTNGYVLQTTGTGVTWVATSSLGITGAAGPSTFTIGNGFIYSATTTDEVAIGSTTAIATLNVRGDGSSNPFIVASSTGTQLLTVLANGNVGIGTSTPAEKLHVDGNILIEAQANSAATWTKTSDTTAGTITSGGTASIASTTAMAVFNGSIYIGTSKAGAAEIYRYSSSTTWVKVSDGTAGTVSAGGTSAINTITSMMVWAGHLYVGTAKTGAAEVYRYDGNSAWTRISSSTAGAIGGNGTTTAINAVSAMGVHGGFLYIGTQKTNGAEVYRYNGPGMSMANTWTKVSHIPTNAGTIGATANVDKVSNIVSLQGFMYITTQETNAGGLYRYDGQSTTATGFTIIGTAGTYTGTASNGASTITAVDNVRTAAVYDGRLYLGIDDGAGTARVVKWDGNPNAGTVYEVVSSSTAGIIAEDVGAQTGIDRIGAMAIYNDRLYIGTVDSTGIAEVYRLDKASTWTKVSDTTAGTIKTSGTSAITGVMAMQTYNNDLWVGTEKAAASEIYKVNYAEGESYELAFHASSNEADAEQNGLISKGWLEFISENTAVNNNGNIGTGKFVFSHGINTVTGAYDLAEDYPTRDDMLSPTDVVTIDTSERGLVKRSVGKNDKNVIGIYSENPALRLSQNSDHIDGARAVPIALAGRVPVKVILENGPIDIGDYLTTGSLPGTAAKAIKPGRVIGRALSAYDGNGEATVTVFIGMETITWNEIQKAQSDVKVLSDTGEAPETPSTLVELVDSVNRSVEDMALAVISKLENTLLVVTNKLVALEASIKSLFVDTLVITPGGNIFLPSGENQVAGAGIILKGMLESFVNNTQIDKNSIISITPTSPVEVPIYVAEKRVGQGFLVRMTKISNNDVTFDWFFIKTYQPKQNSTNEVTAIISTSTNSASTSVTTMVSYDVTAISSSVSTSTSPSTPEPIVGGETGIINSVGGTTITSIGTGEIHVSGTTTDVLQNATTTDVLQNATTTAPIPAEAPVTEVSLDASVITSSDASPPSFQDPGVVVSQPVDTPTDTAAVIQTEIAN